MKRFHVHVSVEDLDASLKFYSTIFATAPTVLKPDYAKWILEDPRVNFAISKRGVKPGVDHLGVQVESDAELTVLREQTGAAEIAMLEQPDAACCYARSDKYWISDPQGIAWETFHTLESILVYGETQTAESKACCGPARDVSSGLVQACCGSGADVTSQSGKSGTCCA
jgi:hypothetical protein